MAGLVPAMFLLSYWQSSAVITPRHMTSGIEFAILSAAITIV